MISCASQLNFLFSLLFSFLYSGALGRSEEWRHKLRPYVSLSIHATGMKQALLCKAYFSVNLVSILTAIHANMTLEAKQIPVNIPQNLEFVEKIKKK